MISVLVIKDVIDKMISQLNDEIVDKDDQIQSVFFSPSENHFVKRLGDAKGIVLAIKMPDADTESDSKDNYAEQNHFLIYILEKTDPGKLSFEKELVRYNYLQALTSKIKKWLWENLMSIQREEIRFSKSFHTEWEYQIKGGWNGLSISFDLENYTL